MSAYCNPPINMPFKALLHANRGDYDVRFSYIAGELEVELANAASPLVTHNTLNFVVLD